MASEQYTENEAWVKLHWDLYASGCSRPAGRRAMAAAYRRFAQHHPGLAALALDEAARCEWEAAEREEVPHAATP